MSKLIVRFDDSALESFHWAVTGSEITDQAIQWLPASEAELLDLGQRHQSVVLVVPQQSVYLTEFEIPARASHQLLASIEYQIEEQLAIDVEQQHVAIGDLSQNPVALAVVSRTLMDRCVELKKLYRLNVAQIIPEMFLCPLPAEPGAASLIETNDGLLLRYGEYQGFACKQDLLPSMLEMIAVQQPISRLDCYLQHLPNLTIEGYTTLIHRFSLDESLIAKQVINLQQRDYQLSSAWRKLLGLWRATLILLAVALLATGVNKALALQDLETELGQIKTSQYELLKAYLPPTTRASDNLKQALVKLLKENQAGQNEASFLDLTQTFTRAKAAHAGVKVGKITYQDKRLSIDVTSPQLSNIESLQSTLESGGHLYKLEDLNIKPDLISARVILQGKTNE